MKFSELYIRKLINGFHYEHILESGLAVFNRRNVVLVHAESNIITLKVHYSGDTEMIAINYEDENSIKEISCSCHVQSRCVHIAASLFYLYNKDIPVHQHEISSNLKLESLRPQEFRRVPTNENLSFKDVIENLFHDNLDYLSKYIKFRFKYNTDNTITGIAENNNNYYRYIETFKVNLKNDENSIWVQCTSCKESTPYLCQHAYFTLKEISGYSQLSSFTNNQLNYAEIIADFAEKERISISTIQKYFELYFNKSNFYLEKTNPSFKSIDELQSTNKTLFSIFSNNFLAPEDIHGTEDINKSFSNGLWWETPKHKELSLIPFILEGKTDKYNTKLVSHFNVVEDYPFFNKLQQKAFEQLSATHNKYIKLSDRLLVNELIKVLKKDLEVFQTAFNYYGDPSEVYSGNYYNKKVKKSALTQFDFSSEELSINYSIDENAEDTILCDLSCRIEISGKTIMQDDIVILHPLFIITKEDKAYLFNRETDFAVIKNMIDTPVITFAKSNIDKILPVLNQINSNYNLEINIEEKIERKILYGGKKQIYFSEIGHKLILKPQILFEEVFIQNAITKQIQEHPDPVIFEVKGTAAEDLTEFLRNQHPSFEEESEILEFFTISVEEMLEDNWFLKFFEKCKEEGIEIFGMDILKNFKFNPNAAQISSHITSGIDWFDVEVEISFGDIQVPLAGWVEMIKENRKYIKLADGSLGIIPQEWLDNLKDIYGLSVIEDGEVKISQYHFSVVDQLFNEHLDEQSLLDIKEKLQIFSNFSEIKDYKVPSAIQADLRPYQVYGYQWLRFLNEYGFGGCLADDMGLGKTLQILCLMAYQKEQKECFSLVIVPNSLIFNWANEIEKFCPSLRYLIHHGPNRNFQTIQKKKFDIVITTYGTALSDIEELKDIEFKHIILDESQAIKNPNSKRYKAVRLLKAENRFVMTGTPIENNTFDLFAQFSFINPGLLGNASQFKKKFSIPIDSLKDTEAADLLRRMVNPYLLRRTKEQVASDLPEKTETILYCEMGSRQQKYYDSVKNDIRSSLMGMIQENGIKKSSFQILEGMLRLRQICNSPKLVDKKAISDSTKMEVLIDHIMNNNNHKSLVFSQFVTMLQLIAEELDKMGIKYAYLDGSTKDRMAEVEKFQNNRRVQVFLISLKAGNTGLNLTAADYVYIVDPWWNPAVEAQAIDRTHRIGQVNHVFAYKLVVKDSIEDKILKLQEKKKNLADDIIQMDTNVFKSLERDDIMGIFD